MCGGDKGGRGVGRKRGDVNAGESGSVGIYMKWASQMNGGVQELHSPRENCQHMFPSVGSSWALWVPGAPGVLLGVAESQGRKVSGGV